MGLPQMMGGVILRRYVVPSAISFAVAILLAIVILMFVNMAILRIPVQSNSQRQESVTRPSDDGANPESKYSAIAERNLFRSKLQTELPRPKTDREIEEDNFVGTLSTFGLRGVWIGDRREDHFAFIDKGPQKGVWIHRNGEQMEGGFTLAEIRPNSVLITKGELGATLTIFTKGFERTDVKNHATIEKAAGKGKKR